MYFHHNFDSNSSLFLEGSKLYDWYLAMESDTERRGSMMIEHDVPHSMQIDPERARFPCCIVWTPLPVISWFLPFVGHVGIAREDGVILDFAGPNFVCVDDFAFGAVARYIQINKDKCSIVHHPSTTFRSEEEYRLVESGRNQYTWDDALRKSTQEYQHRTYNILTCNCHSFVANNLNRLEFHGGGWNVVNVAALILLKGEWVDKASMVGSCLPFLFLFFIGITFGGVIFLTFSMIREKKIERHQVKFYENFPNIISLPLPLPTSPFPFPSSPNTQP